jgi:hypothetical protein
MDKHIMAAGTYYVGDLCYVIDENSGMGAREDWDEVCKLMWPDDFRTQMIDGKLKLADGREFCIFGTQYGDGEYMVRDQGHGYLKSTYVDSGTIGCIKIEDIKNYDTAQCAKLGNIVTFEEDFECYESQGTMVFGHLTIETGDDEQEDDDVDDSYYDEADDEDS